MDRQHGISQIQQGQQQGRGQQQQDPVALLNLPVSSPTQADLELWLNVDFGLLNEASLAEEICFGACPPDAPTLLPDAGIHSRPQDALPYSPAQDDADWLQASARQQLALQNLLASPFGLFPDGQSPVPLETLFPLPADSNLQTSTSSTLVSSSSSVKEPSKRTSRKRKADSMASAKETPPSERTSACPSASPPSMSNDTTTESRRSSACLDEDEKRRRNTEASARFRAKKKQKEQALLASAQDMADRLRFLETKNRDLETEVKWLKQLLLEKKSGEKGPPTTSEVPPQPSQDSLFQPIAPSPFCHRP